MATSEIKRGDEVVIISGAQRGKRGKVVSFVADRNRVLVEGVRLIKKAMRKNQTHPEGGIIEREGSIHVSNVMLAARFDKSTRRNGAKGDKSEKKTKAKK